MPAFSQRICGVTLAVFVIVLGSCDRVDSDKTAKNRSSSPAASPTTNDLWVARHAMSVGDVLLMLKGGDTQQTIINEVKRRRFVGNVVESTELELTLNGARHELISALKDKDNWLTDSQEQAYGQLMAQRSPAH
jgi:hypothetical protein